MEVMKKIEVCDRCERTPDNIILRECPVCGRVVCYRCMTVKSSKAPDVCEDCAMIPTVRERREAFEERYWKAYRKEKTALTKLGEKNG